MSTEEARAILISIGILIGVMFLFSKIFNFLEKHPKITVVLQIIFVLFTTSLFLIFLIFLMLRAFNFV